jgi:hypothetical protein
MGVTRRGFSRRLFFGGAVASAVVAALPVGIEAKAELTQFPAAPIENDDDMVPLMLNLGGRMGGICETDGGDYPQGVGPSYKMVTRREAREIQARMAGMSEVD